MTDKPRSEQNQQFLDTLFLDGGNAAYLEQMQARYAEDPNSVDVSWQAYFSSLGEDRSNAVKNAEGPSWKRNDWPHDNKSELTSALTGDWADEGAVTAKLSHKTVSYTHLTLPTIYSV